MSLIEETTARVRAPQHNLFMGGEIAQAAARAELKQTEFIRAVASTNWDTSDSEARAWDDATLTSGLDPWAPPAMMVRAGDVYYANLDPAKGTEQKGDRPVLVVNVVSLGPRAIVVPLTTSVRNWATRIRVSIHGITSEAMCEQVRTIDVSRLEDNLYGRVDGAKLQEVQQTIARLVGVY